MDTRDVSDEDIHMDGDDDQLAEGTANDAEDSFPPWLFRRLSPVFAKAEALTTKRMVSGWAAGFTRQTIVYYP
jgi:hypothetical protein